MTATAPPAKAALLLIAPELAADPALPGLAARLAVRGARHVVVAGVVTPRALLAAVRSGDGDPVRSWLVSRDAGTEAAAATAGLAGLVLVGITAADRDAGVLVRHVDDLAAAPIAMVPRGGGCWHG